MRWVYALVLTFGTAALFGLDAWASWLTSSNSEARAFILSDAFFPMFFGGIAVAVAVMLAAVCLLALIPSRSGRKAPERGN
ncbi:hypothetical protein [Novosphingobium guangzhouense]|uniref:Uncharacterized protein n=1 Tax=Novosphingobium guangzhouense TaxID=1850347 RepID=A0A2K2FYT1_9SPHN|nr:hypothetical protein [Novosphingobium guangzhouense]PNU03955.1 hypothetical protein A8V01_04860 [Novosphingobium guangzhouense]